MKPRKKTPRPKLVVAGELSREEERELKEALRLLINAAIKKGGTTKAMGGRLIIDAPKRNKKGRLGNVVKTKRGAK